MILPDFLMLILVVMMVGHDGFDPYEDDAMQIMILRLKGGSCNDSDGVGVAEDVMVFVRNEAASSMACLWLCVTCAALNPRFAAS